MLWIQISVPSDLSAPRRSPQNVVLQLLQRTETLKSLGALSDPHRRTHTQGLFSNNLQLLISSSVLENRRTECVKFEPKRPFCQCSNQNVISDSKMKKRKGKTFEHMHTFYPSLWSPPQALVSNLSRPGAEGSPAQLRAVL